MGRFAVILLLVSGTVALQVGAQAALLGSVRFIDRRTRGATELRRTFWISRGAVLPLMAGHLAQVGLWAGGGSTFDASGYDAGKKVVGRKHHLLTDTLGLLLGIVVRPADMQNRDGAEPLLRQTWRHFPFLERVIGDAGYQGPKMATTMTRTGTWTLEIVQRSDRHHFVALPKR